MYALADRRPGIAGCRFRNRVGADGMRKYLGLGVIAEKIRVRVYIHRAARLSADFLTIWPFNYLGGASGVDLNCDR